MMTQRENTPEKLDATLWKNQQKKRTYKLKEKTVHTPDSIQFPF